MRLRLFPSIFIIVLCLKPASDNFISFGYMNYMNFVYHSCSLRVQLLRVFVHALYDMGNKHYTNITRFPPVLLFQHSRLHLLCSRPPMCTSGIMVHIGVLYLQADRGVSPAVMRLYDVIHSKSGGGTSQQSTTQHHGTEKHDGVQKCIFHK